MIRRCLIAIVVLSLAVPAAVADSLVTVRQISGNGAEQTWLIAATGRTLNPNEIQVTENGEPIHGVSVSTSADPVAMALLIDASSSMAGAPLKAALATARSLVADNPPNVRSAVYRFNNEVAVVAPFGATAAAQTAALATVTTGGGTQLYDALGRVITDVSHQPAQSRVIVVMSDGSDNGSKATLDTVAAAASTADVRVFTIGLASHAFDPNALRGVAARTGGTYSQAPDAQRLEALGRSLTASLTTLYEVSFTSNLTAPGAAGHALISAPGFAPAAANYSLPPAPVIGRRTAFWQESWVVAAVAGIVALAVLTIALLFARTRRMSMADRVSEYHMTAEAHEARQSLFLDDLLDRTDKRLKDVAWAQRLSLELDRADIPIRPSQLVYLACAGGTLVGLVLAVVLRNPWAILFGLLVPLIAWMSVQHRAAQRMKAFQDQLPDNLAILSQSLRAGFSLQQAIDSVADNAAEPSKSEFRRVISQTRLGGNLDLAMDELGVRMRSRDLDWVIAVVAIQSRIGGNMAEILDSVAASVLERQRLQREVQSLTAQGRMTMIILIILPIGMGAFLYLANPDLMHELLDRTAGQILLGSAAAMTALGAFLISRIVRIDL